MKLPGRRPLCSAAPAPASARPGPRVGLAAAPPPRPGRTSAWAALLARPHSAAADPRPAPGFRGSHLGAAPRGAPSPPPTPASRSALSEGEPHTTESAWEAQFRGAQRLHRTSHLESAEDGAGALGRLPPVNGVAQRVAFRDVFLEHGSGAPLTGQGLPSRVGGSPHGSEAPLSREPSCFIPLCG